MTDFNDFEIDELLDEIHGDEKPPPQPAKPASKVTKNTINHWVRQQWNIGSKVEVFSSSKQQWLEGDITNVFHDAEGEWLEIQYAVNGTIRVKQSPRYDNQAIRPYSKALPIYKYVYRAIQDEKEQQQARRGILST